MCCVRAPQERFAAIVAAHGPIRFPHHGASGSAGLDETVWGLATRHPELSVATGLWDWQRRRSLASLPGAACWRSGDDARRAARRDGGPVPVRCRAAVSRLWHLFSPSVPTAEPLAIRIDAELLPLYSVLVPLYREASVVPHLLGALSALDYPAARLQR